MDTNFRGKFCYNDFEPNPVVANQGKLLARLNTLGYDDGKNYRLTVPGAVPITALLFCLKDAYTELSGSLDALKIESPQAVELEHSELPAPLQKIFLPNTPARYFKAYAPAIHQSFSSSGFQEALYCDIYSTSLFQVADEYQFEGDIFARRDIKAILIPDRGKAPIPLHSISKSLFKFLEFCYALTERIEWEVKNIMGKGSKLGLDNFSKFNQACGMRNGLIHKHGIPDLDFSPATGNLMVSNQNLSDFVGQAYSQAFEWIDQVYGSLDTHIETQGVWSLK